MEIGHECWYYNTLDNNKEEYYFFKTAIENIEFERNNPHLKIITCISEGVILY